MKCPNCRHTEHRVMRSEPRPGAIRRIRQCDQCGHRWPTLELEEQAIADDRRTLAEARELAKKLVIP
jgi:transcriptional regulator NrdR family protein